MTTWSSAWLTTYAICSGKSRMLIACSTAPMDWTPRYASRCSSLFHMNVPTRWSPSMPRPRSACASRAQSFPTSAYVDRRGPSAVQVTTSDTPCSRLPYSSNREMSSGPDIIVDSIVGMLTPSGWMVQ